MDEFYKFMSEQLGDEDEVRFALTFEELDEYLPSWGISGIGANRSRTSRIERLRSALSELAVSCAITHPETIIRIREYVSAESREVAGFGFVIKKVLSDVAC